MDAPALTTAPAGDDAPPLERPTLFVGGNSRSGTTMLGEILGMHAQAFMLTELHFWEKLWTPEQAGETLDADEASLLAARLIGHQRVAGVILPFDPEQFRAEGREIVAALDAGPYTAPEVFAAYMHHEALLNGKRVPVEQTPRNVFYIPEILRLFPQGRVVVIVRDPRDVLASQKNKSQVQFLGAQQPFKERLRVRANYSPITMSLLWNASIKAGDRYADDPRVHVVRFEDVLRDSEATLRQVCEFAGLEYDPAMLGVRQVKSSFREGDAPQTGLNPSAAGRWQRGGLEPAEIYLCQRLCGDNMLRHGYQIEPTHARPLSLAGNVAAFPAKAGVALALNRSRYQSFGRAIRRRFANR